jgi:hypothetical protein
MHCWLLLVGCDACPGRVKSKGPKVAYSLVNKKYSKLSSEALHHALANEISTMKGATVKYAAAVLHFANSLLYEKTNDGYIHESPVELEQYLADFASENTVIVDGPSMGMCKRCNGEHHPFLEAEGVFTCEACHETVCWFCYMSKNAIEVLVGERLLCFECS